RRRRVLRSDSRHADFARVRAILGPMHASEPRKALGHRLTEANVYRRSTNRTSCRMELSRWTSNLWYASRGIGSTRLQPRVLATDVNRDGVSMTTSFPRSVVRFGPTTNTKGLPLRTTRPTDSNI